MRPINRFILHCSASAWGDRPTVDSWHQERGFRSPSGVHIGYHFLILNGYRRASSDYQAHLDGRIEIGRPLHEVGAHTANENHDSIGICFIGTDRFFTVKQIHAGVTLISTLLEDYPHASVHGHYEFNAGKTCPDFEIGSFVALMRGARD